MIKNHDSNVSQNHYNFEKETDLKLFLPKLTVTIFLDTEMLTGDAAILRTYAEFSRQPEQRCDCIVQIKATSEGITLTDRQRKIFFRKHFPAETISHCGLEPNRKSVIIEKQKLRVFGFVAKRSSSNVAILLTEKEKNSLDELIQFVNKVKL